MGQRPRNVLKRWIAAGVVLPRQVPKSVHILKLPLFFPACLTGFRVCLFVGIIISARMNKSKFSFSFDSFELAAVSGERVTNLAVFLEWPDHQLNLMK